MGKPQKSQFDLQYDQYIECKTAAFSDMFFEMVFGFTGVLVVQSLVTYKYPVKLRYALILPCVGACATGYLISENAEAYCKKKWLNPDKPQTS